jgi:hypothetical protein
VDLGPGGERSRARKRRNRASPRPGGREWEWCQNGATPFRHSQRARCATTRRGSWPPRLPSSKPRRNRALPVGPLPDREHPPAAAVDPELVVVEGPVADAGFTPELALVLDTAAGARRAERGLPFPGLAHQGGAVRGRALGKGGRHRRCRAAEQETSGPSDLGSGAASDLGHRTRKARRRCYAGVRTLKGIELKGGVVGALASRGGPRTEVTDGAPHSPHGRLPSAGTRGCIGLHIGRARAHAAAESG